jgi:SAM-dependent methyltransferase
MLYTDASRYLALDLDLTRIGHNSMQNPSYRTQHLERQRPSGYARDLVQYLDQALGLSGKSLVDLGCGTGGYTAELARVARAVSAVDLDPPKTIPGVQSIARLDLQQPLSYGERYDVVWSKSVLEHLTDPLTYLRNAYLCAKPGGKLVLFVPDWVTCQTVFYDDYTHVRPWTQESLKDCLSLVWTEVTVRKVWQFGLYWKYPRLFSAIRPLIAPFTWGDIGYRMRHAALFAVGTAE